MWNGPNSFSRFARVFLPQASETTAAGGVRLCNERLQRRLLEALTLINANGSFTAPTPMICWRMFYK